MGIMFDANDTLFATEFAEDPSSDLFILDPSTGVATLVGNTGIDYLHGGDIYIPAPDPGIEFCGRGYVYGRGYVDYIQLYQSDPNNNDVSVSACDLNLTFTTINNQIYQIPATAFGTQLNLALLKAYHETREVWLCLGVELYPFVAKVIAVNFE